MIFILVDLSIFVNEKSAFNSLAVTVYIIYSAGSLPSASGEVSFYLSIKAPPSYVLQTL